MLNRKKLDVKILRETFRYDPQTGKLFWKERPQKNGKKSPSIAWFNSVYAGKKAGWLRNDGYTMIKVRGVTYCAHRVCYAIHYGVSEIEQIDHINGKRSDNRIENLRLVDNSTNQKNRALGKNSKSGHLGVCWHKKRKKWQAYIKENGRQIYIGLFSSLGEAVAARKLAQKKYKYHEGHGKPITATHQ